MKINLPLFDDYLLNLKSNNYSDETVYNYERDIGVFENFLNDIKIEINPESNLELTKGYLVYKNLN